jgi:hypothetical protein
VNVYVKDPENTREELAEAIYILYYLRKHTKIWDQVFGVAARQQKKTWEQKADELLSRLLSDREMGHSEKIKVIEK